MMTKIFAVKNHKKRLDIDMFLVILEIVRVIRKTENWKIIFRKKHSNYTSSQK